MLAGIKTFILQVVHFSHQLFRFCISDQLQSLVHSSLSLRIHFSQNIHSGVLIMLIFYTFLYQFYSGQTAIQQQNSTVVKQQVYGDQITTFLRQSDHNSTAVRPQFYGSQTPNLQQSDRNSMAVRLEIYVSKFYDCHTIILRHLNYLRQSDHILRR